MYSLNRFLALLVLGAISLLPINAWSQAAEESDYSVDEEGRLMRVRFDPASRIALGLGYGTRGANDETLSQLALWAGLEYRFILDYGEGKNFVQWRLDNQLFTGMIEPLARRHHWTSKSRRGRLQRMV